MTRQLWRWHWLRWQSSLTPSANVTLRHLFTAHMSGNSARLGVHLGHFDLHMTQPLARTVFFGGIWCLYIAGAVLGSYTDSLWRLWSLACPLVVLALAIAADLWQPFHPS